MPHASFRGRLGVLIGQLWRFAWVEAQCCIFAVAFFAGLALSRVVPLPIARYDALLLWCLAVQAAMLLIGRFVWIAENLATFLGAWRYPDQAQVWHGVHYAKISSWALLVILNFVLIARLKGLKAAIAAPGRLVVLGLLRETPPADTNPP